MCGFRGCARIGRWANSVVDAMTRYVRKFELNTVRIFTAPDIVQTLSQNSGLTPMRIRDTGHVDIGLISSTAD